MRAHYVTLRELVIRHTGGWDDPDTRARVEGLCGEAIALFEDAECRAHLRSVCVHARQLFSRDGHFMWRRKTMTGADFLRLQMLIVLESLNSRLLLIESERSRRAAA
jgi:hypothetical protein